MSTKKTKTVNRKDHFLAAWDVGQGVQTTHGTTMGEVQSKVTAALGGSPCVFRPDPNEPRVTFIYNTTQAGNAYGEANSALPVGYISRESIPIFIGAMEMARVTESLGGTAPSSPDEVDSLLGALEGV